MPLFLVSDAETGNQLLVEAPRSLGAARKVKDQFTANLDTRFQASEVDAVEAIALYQRGIKLFEDSSPSVAPNPGGGDEGEGAGVPTVAPSPKDAPEESGTSSGEQVDAVAAASTDMPRFLQKDDEGREHG